ncbi:hypothetical protein FGF80_04655 [Natrinema pallidum]|uniref:Pyrrolo-quinoline quinone repeat domain-containing protein n=1 Tax=Natrinema pallidum TaxID=69527 RepID=A0A4P9TCX3_9EURY|nr:hypothetical protein FGF80_04655 [Natrinema pallidum]
MDRDGYRNRPNAGRRLRHRLHTSSLSRAFDSTTGTRRWQADVGRIGGSPTVADGVLYVGTWDAVVHALDIADGSPRWTYDADYEISRSVAVTDGVLVYGDDYGNIVALGEPEPEQ